MHVGTPDRERREPDAERFRVHRAVPGAHERAGVESVESAVREEG